MMLERLQVTFQQRVAEKSKIEDNAKVARAKMDQVCPFSKMMSQSKPLQAVCIYA